MHDPPPPPPPPPTHTHTPACSPGGYSTNGDTARSGATGEAACSACPAGMFAGIGDLDFCQACPTGMISTEKVTGNVACTPW